MADRSNRAALVRRWRPASGHPVTCALEETAPSRGTVEQPQATVPSVNPLPSSPRASLVIRPLDSRTDRETFIRLPGRLHRDDAHWIEPLHFERRQHLSAKNPVFEHVTWQGWLAWAGDEPVGRISAQIDALHRAQHGADTGHFGMLDAIDDPAVFAALIGAAE
jgi:hypothetical protein